MVIAGGGGGGGGNEIQCMNSIEIDITPAAEEYGLDMLNYCNFPSGKKL